MLKNIFLKRSSFIFFFSHNIKVKLPLYLQMEAIWSENHSLTFYSPLHVLSLLSVCFAGLLPSSDGCGCNNDPTDGFIRGRLRQPAGGLFRGNQELKCQELCVKRRLTASDTASVFSCWSRILLRLWDWTVAGLVSAGFYTHTYVHSSLRNAFVHFPAYAWGLKHVHSFSHANEMDLALLATCVSVLA